MTSWVWYADRPAGLVALVLLTAGVCLGIALASRARSSRWPAFAIEEIHRYLGLLTAAFICIHGLAILGDTYVPYSVRQVLVPGTAPSRALPVAVGVVAAELLVALALTNRFRRRLPYTFWRRAHYFNFLVWILALAHGIAAGTDSSEPWGVIIYATCAASVFAMLAWRLDHTPGSTARKAREQNFVTSSESGSLKT